MVDTTRVNGGQDKELMMDTARVNDGQDKELMMGKAKELMVDTAKS